MNARHTYRLAALAAALSLPILASAAATETYNGPGEAPRHGKRVLSQGMSEGEIRAIVGAPLEVKPMKAPDSTRAEQWIYRRSIGSETNYDASDIQFIPAYVGPGRGDRDNIALVAEPVYRMKRTEITQVTALLLVEGTLVMARQWTEREMRIND